VRLYHVSNEAAKILEAGFQDGAGFYRSGKMHRGVWLFDRPVENDEQGAAGPRTIVVDIPDDLALRHEWLEKSSDYRKFLVPASIVNRYLDAARVESPEE
jgi:hypothetical protein